MGTFTRRQYSSIKILPLWKVHVIYILPKQKWAILQNTSHSQYFKLKDSNNHNYANERIKHTCAHTRTHTHTFSLLHSTLPHSKMGSFPKIPQTIICISLQLKQTLEDNINLLSRRQELFSWEINLITCVYFLKLVRLYP